jgi:hypothetical protein
MIDETDLSAETKWLYEERSRIVIDNLNRKNINAQYAPGRKEGLSAVLEMIPEGVTVSRGDSVSVEQIGIIPALIKRSKNRLIDPFKRDSEGYFAMGDAERLKMQREAFLIDVFLAGTNAVTLDGKLVNIDARGNRVAPMIFGPDKVILIIGANKIVKDVNEALERIRQVAAPMNAKRHALKHHHQGFADLPCASTGKCIDCNHDWRICRYTLIIEGAMVPQQGRINVLMVREELGI